VRNRVSTQAIAAVAALLLLPACCGCEDLLQIRLGWPLTGSIDIGLSPLGIDLGLNAPLGAGGVAIETGWEGTSVTCTGPGGEEVPCN
jgi:hypothetical protein